MVVGNSEGVQEVYKAKIFIGKYEAKQEFPGRWRGSK